MPSFRYFLSAACVLLIACKSQHPAAQPKGPDFTKAFSNLPLPPDPELVSRSNGSDALQLTIHSPASMDQVTAFYRQVLSGEKWRLISDRNNPDGSTTMYAEQNGPPLWVRIWKLGDRGTMVELTGAVVDTLKSKHPGPKPAAKQGT
jgi:hypothetical protein